MEPPPTGTAYLVETKDRARSIRSKDYAATISSLKQRINMQYVKAQSITNKPDVLFYFTGLTHVPDIKTNRFLPGAIADHLTSAGGNLTGKGKQMSILRWLELEPLELRRCSGTMQLPPKVLTSSVIDRYTQGIA